MNQHDVIAWGKTWKEAFLWRCEEACRCTQPVVTVAGPDAMNGFPHVQRSVLWHGTFLELPSLRQIILQIAELRREAAAHQIILGRHFSGKRVVTAQEVLS